MWEGTRNRRTESAARSKHGLLKGTAGFYVKSQSLMNMLMTIFIRASCQSNIHLRLNHPAVWWGWISICPCSFSEWLYESAYFYVCVSLCCPPQPSFLHPFLAGVIEYELNTDWITPTQSCILASLESSRWPFVHWCSGVQLKWSCSLVQNLSPNLCWDEGLSDPNMLESSGQGAK